MRLHEEPDIFKDAVSLTAEYLRLPEIYVEKDYWVTLALHRIFTSVLAEFVVFKGGTALAKCHSFIKRFSEDVDLVVIKDQGLTANQLKQRLKAISNTVAETLPEIEREGITNKKGMIRKTAHSYSRQFTGEFGQVRDMIILESSWLGSPEPTVRGEVSSFVYDMMVAKGQDALAEEYGLTPFGVSILAPTRTLCEKIMSLVRFSYTPEPISDLRNKIRHIYDLHQLLQQKDMAIFFQSAEFDQMLHKVAKDDEVSFRNNKEWLYHHPAHALVFADLEKIWPQLRATYNGRFKSLVYGDLPDEQLILGSLSIIGEIAED